VPSERARNRAPAGPVSSKNLGLDVEWPPPKFKRRVIVKKTTSRSLLSSFEGFEGERRVGAMKIA
jgi:hypothetical protein